MGPSPTPQPTPAPTPSAPNQAWSAKTTRRVPLQTPMFEGTQASGTSPGFDPTLLGRLSRTWIKFWEQIDQLGGGSGGAVGPFQRTLLVKSTAVADDIADHVTCYGPVPGVVHTVILVTAVLRKAIAADLIIRVNNVSGVTTNVVGTFTVPMATTVNTVLSFTGADITTPSCPDLSVFTWDITASDGSSDSAGVCSLTVAWQP
jgi:hypothetical protein